MADNKPNKRTAFKDTPIAVPEGMLLILAPVFDGGATGVIQMIISEDMLKEAVADSPIISMICGDIEEARASAIVLHQAGAFPRVDKDDETD